MQKVSDLQFSYFVAPPLPVINDQSFNGTGLMSINLRGRFTALSVQFIDSLGIEFDKNEGRNSFKNTGHSFPCIANGN